MSAIDAGPVEAPQSWPSVRRAMSDGALHAVAVSAASTVAAENPARYTRRCPWMSPSLTRIGIAMANARIGAVTTQVIADSVDPRSAAIVGSEAANTETGKAPTPTPTRSVIRMRRRQAHKEPFDMDFSFTEEQDDLAALARRILHDRVAHDSLRARPSII